MSNGPLNSPKPLVMVALGTSFTARGDWSPVTRTLEDCHQRPVRFVNVGRGGANSRYGVKMTPQLADMRPDIIFVEFAGNDADVRAAMVPSRSEWNIRAIIDAFRATVPQARIFLVLTHEFAGLRGCLRPFLNIYNERHNAVALGGGATVIDIRSAWRSLPMTTRRRILPDGVHLTVEGFANFAAPEIVAAMTKQKLDQRFLNSTHIER